MDKNIVQYFKYGEKEIQYLKKKDKKLSAAIDQIGMIERRVNPNIFESLIESIIGQQISSKAAKTVWNRICILLKEVTPENILKTDIEQIQKCGITLKKAGYIKDIAQAAISGQVDFNCLHNLSDNEIIKQLTQLKGIGEWTVEMLLIFSLNRPDIVSYKDLAIRRGMMNLYNLKELPKEKFEKYQKRYSPYGSTASLYLWHLSVMQDE